MWTARRPQRAASMSQIGCPPSISALVLVSLWFAGNATRHITDAELVYDASQNAKIAYYLVHTGTYTSSKREPRNLSKAMKREPVPVLAISAFLLLHPSFDARYK